LAVRREFLRQDGGLSRVVNLLQNQVVQMALVMMMKTVGIVRRIVVSVIMNVMYMGIVQMFAMTPDYGQVYVYGPIMELSAVLEVST
jgi:hypothetical protein